MLDNLGLNLGESIDYLVESYSKRLGEIQAYTIFSNSAVEEIAREDIQIIIQCLELNDCQPFVKMLETRVVERFYQGFTIDELLRSLEALEVTLMPRVDTAQEAVFLWSSFSQARSYLSSLTKDSSHENTDTYRRMFEEAVMGMYRTTPDGRILAANEALIRMMGFTSFAELAQVNLIQSGYAPDSSRTKFQELIEDNGKVVGYEAVWQKKDGSPLYIRENSRAVRDNEGKTLFYEGTVEDITDSKKTEEALRSSEEVYQTIFNSTPIMFWLKDAQNRTLRINQAAADFEGVQPEDVNGKSCYDLYPREQADAFYEDDLAVIRSGRPRLGIVEQHTAVGSGDLMWVETGKVPVRDEEGNISGVLAFAIDITERKKSEEELHKLGLALEQAADGIAIADLDGKLVFANSAWADMHGYTLDELEGAHLSIFHTVNQLRKEVIPFNQQAMESGTCRGEIGHLRKDGLTFPTMMTNTTLRDDAGNMIGLVATARDISEQKRAEQALLESEQRFRQFYESIQDGIVYIDLENNILDANDIFQKMIGYNLSALQKMKLAELTLEKWRAIEAEILEDQVLREGFAIYEKEYVHKDGRVFPVEMTMYQIRDEQSHPAGFYGFVRDISRRKRLEQQIQETLERRGYQVQISTQIAQEIANAPDLDALFDKVVTMVKEQFNYYHVQLLRYEAGRDAMVLVSGYGEVGSKMLEMGHSLPMGAGLVGTSAATGKTLMRTDLSGDPDWQPNPLLPETKGEIAVPIRLGESVLGVLDVQSDQSGVLGQDDSLLLEGLCGQIAVAIEDTRLRQEMKERLNELDTLYRATSREGWQTFRETTETPDGYIYDRVNVNPAVDMWLPEVGAAAEQGKIVSGFENDSSKDGHTAVAAPLTLRGEIIGTLGVFDDPQNPLSEDDIGLIEQLSDQVAQALEGARLFEQTQTALAETQALYTGSARVIAAESAEDVLLAVVENTVLRQLDRASLVYFDQPWEETPPNSAITVAAWERSGDNTLSPIGSSFPVLGNPLFSTIQLRQPTILSDVLTDERLDQAARDAMTAAGMRGGLVMPLVAGEVWFGVLSGQLQSPLKLSEEDLRRVSTLVDQSATVIQSLRLQNEMRERVSELTKLQRMMSREAWASYQTQAGSESWGYLFDRVQVKPLSPELVSGPEEGRNGGGSEVGVLADALKDVFSTTLAVRGEPIGVLGVRQESGYVLSQNDEAFLLAVSEQVAQAMERARLIEQTQKAAVELQAVADVSTATSTILNPEELLQSVVDLTKRNFGLYHAHVYLLDDVGKNLDLVVGAGEIGRSMAAEGWGISLDEENSLVASVARTRQGQVITDVRQYMGYMPNPLLPDTLSELAVPMIVGDTLLGVFDVQSDAVGRFTEDEDVGVYGTLASQVAVALQNAKLYAEQLDTVERLRELDNMKSAFLANMSHELRTPLNSILGFTQVIQEGLDGPLTDMMESDLELIEKNGKHLLNLINDVLDMAKIEAGRLTLSPEPLSLYELLDDVIVSNGLLARDRNLYLNLEADPDADWTVIADHVRMRQIFINLIGNSIKFTESGGITVEFERLLATSEFEKSRVQVRICDTGVGIPPDRLEDIFEAFSQVDSTTTRKAGGTGLGLPISRRLVELHGGKLWAESKGIPGQGSVFYLELPIGK